MTILEILIALSNAMAGRCTAIITFGSYIGTRYIALKGEINDLVHSVQYYDILSNTKIDPNGLEINNNNIELFANGYTGEYFPVLKYRVKTSDMQIKITAPTYPSLAKTSKRIAQEINIDESNIHCVGPDYNKQGKVNIVFVPAKKLFKDNNNV